MVFWIRLVRGTLSLGLDLVFCLSLSLIFYPRCPVRKGTFLEGLFGLWSLVGEGSPQPVLSVIDLGGILLKCVFLIARTLEGL